MASEGKEAGGDLTVDQPALSALMKSLDLGTPDEVTLLTAGVVNGVFAITSSMGKKYILRLAADTLFGKKKDSARKTESEVAVMSFVAKNTSIPVPAILAHSAGDDAKLLGGCHYILMAHAGERLADVCGRGDLSMDEMRKYMDHVAEIITELRTFTFKKSGCLTSDGEVGSYVMYSGGPEDSCAGYYKRTILTQTEDLASNPDFAEFVPRVVKFCETVLPTACEGDSGTFVLTHYDIHGNNLLVNPDSDDRRITALVDWEWAGALPADEEFMALSRPGGMFLPRGLMEYLMQKLASGGVTRPADYNDRNVARQMMGSCFAANCYKAWGIPDEAAFVKQAQKKLNLLLTVNGC